METKTQHTPGPWESVKYPSNRNWEIQTRENYCAESGEGPIRHVPIAQLYADGQPDRANARLIAAAPELLAELKAMHSEYCKDCKGGCPTLEIIAKAEGR